MLNPNETESLLSELCFELGFCLPPEDEDKLIETPPNTVEAFTDAVFLAEGLDPQNADRHLYRQVRDKVAETFQRHFNNNFFDN